MITEKYIDPWASSAKFQLGLFWQKIQAVKEALDQGYKWVMWIDADALFTDFDKKIEDVILEHGSETIDFLISNDNFSTVNTGIFLVRQSDWSHRMFETISALHPHYKNEYIPEQLAVQDFISGFVHKGEDGRIALTPLKKRRFHGKPISKAAVLTQRVLNSYYKGNSALPGASSVNAVWQPGDYITHFAVRMEKKEEEMRALVACFKEKCGEDYEHYSQCMRQCE